MSKDISTMYTKELNKKTGRRGWYDWKVCKETVISPANYGDYILKRKNRNSSN